MNQLAPFRSADASPALIAAGAVLVVTRLDRLAIDAGQGAGFRSLGDTWADNTTPHGRLTLTVLGGLAKFERELIASWRSNPSPIRRCAMRRAGRFISERDLGLACIAKVSRAYFGRVILVHIT